jgi:hypothetical protein
MHVTRDIISSPRNKYYLDFILKFLNYLDILHVARDIISSLRKKLFRFYIKSFKLLEIYIRSITRLRLILLPTSFAAKTHHIYKTCQINKQNNKYFIANHRLLLRQNN